jgi:hypothetical protein
MGNVVRLPPTLVNQKLAAHRTSCLSRAGRVSERTDFLRRAHRVPPIRSRSQVFPSAGVRNGLKQSVPLVSCVDIDAGPDPRVAPKQRDRTSVEYPLPFATIRHRPRTPFDQAKSFATLRHRPGRAYSKAGVVGSSPIVSTGKYCL